MENPHHTVTTKRMERFTAGGQLLSVTDVKTTHFDDQMPRTNYSTSTSGSFVGNRPPQDSEFTLRSNYTTTTTFPAGLPPRPPPREREYYRIPRPSVEREREREPPREREYPIRKIDRVVPHEIIREYSKNPSNESTGDWRTTDSYVRKTSILKPTSQTLPPPPPPPSYQSRTSTSQRVEWREPLDCLINRINRIRQSMACHPLQPSVRLADIAAQWARMLALRGEFRTDRERYMNIWMGNRVTESVADTWWDESEEYGTRNFLDDTNLSWVGVASVFSEQYRQFIVVAVYE
ncbi:unnamed protein product [Caenorhabditis angaria]|uniref:SCP domain-containing protein n=1 Tax=Caenorhabditis angaria TaxID=860376 RepID=A0A9P1J047_9PELO|nr:unnamed protein product [Caenorhabditis angaria]